MQLYQAPTGKQTKVAEVTLARKYFSGDTVLVEAQTGIKPIGDSTRGIKAEVLDGEYSNETLIFPRTTLLAV